MKVGHLEQNLWFVMIRTGSPVSSQENSFAFLPVWWFCIANSYEIDKGDRTGSALQVEETSFDIYDAITGEEIPYDIG